MMAALFLIYDSPRDVNACRRFVLIAWTMADARLPLGVGLEALYNNLTQHILQLWAVVVVAAEVEVPCGHASKLLLGLL